jgi:N,N'-diacetyllegionaminate synthase
MKSFVEFLETRTHPFLVAEIGVNHEGSLEKAKELVSLAKESGADAVKFQTFTAENYVSSDDQARFERVKRFALPYRDFLELKQLCDSLDIVFFSTPLDTSDIDFLNSFVPFFKVSSGDLTNLTLIAHVASTGKPLILSTGFASHSEIQRSVECFRENATKENVEELVLMHTVSRYPTLASEANLRNILWLRDKFKIPVGYSDHTIGIEAALVASALGASIIEKHFTDTKVGRTFRDHTLSAEPHELRELKNAILRQVELLGDLDRTISSEQKNQVKEFRRSLAASRELQAGHRVTEDDFIDVRPGTGLPPISRGFLIGRKLARRKAKGSLMHLEDFL